MDLESEIEAIVASHGASLYEIETLQENDETIYRISIAKEGGVDVETCAEISRTLSPFLDVHPPMREAYRLEVSSPGIERKLTKPKHFQLSVGEKVKAKILGGDKLKGTLKNADENGITIENKEGEHRFAYDQLGIVKTYFEF